MAGALRRRRSPPETLPLEGTYTDNLTDPAFGAAIGGFPVAFRASPLFFRAFPVTSRRPERPHSRVFYQPGKKTLQARPPSGVFCRGIAARSGRFGVIAFVRPRANRRLGGAYRCFGVANCSLVSAKCRLCGRGSLCPETFLCRFVANTCGFLVRAHGVR